MRSRKALISTLSGISYELVSAICGFIVPRLILGAFGSAYNGITSSITQFLSCVVLFKTSIAGVTRAALYKPLSEKNERDISGIFNATQQFMRKIALIYAVNTVVFSAVYPFLVQEEFSWGFSASLVLVMGLSHFVQYYFGMTWQILLEADFLVNAGEDERYGKHVAEFRANVFRTPTGLALLESVYGEKE